MCSQLPPVSPRYYSIWSMHTPPYTTFRRQNTRSTALCIRFSCRHTHSFFSFPNSSLEFCESSRFRAARWMAPPWSVQAAQSGFAGTNWYNCQDHQVSPWFPWKTVPKSFHLRIQDGIALGYLSPAVMPVTQKTTETYSILFLLD